MSGLCVRSAACSPNGKNSKSNSLDEAIRLSHFEYGVCVGISLYDSAVVELAENSKLVLGVAVSRGGRRMRSVSNYETVQVWDARTAEQSGHQ